MNLPDDPLDGRPSTAALLGAEVDLPRRQPAAAPDPEAEALLAGLKQRIAAAAPPPPSIAQAVLQREGRARRTERAAKALASAQPIELAAAAPAVVYAEGRDLREDSDSFRDATPEEQARLRAVWQQQAAADQQRRSESARERRGTFWSGYIVFFATGVPLSLRLGLGSLLAMALGGVLAGLVWQRLPRDRFAFAISAAAIFGGCAVVPSARAMASDGMTAAYVFSVWSLTVWLAALAAMGREMRDVGGMRS